MADTSKLNDWLQIVGMLGLIGSLIFVGMQIRQDREIALSSVYQARSDATVESSLAAKYSGDDLHAGATAYTPVGKHVGLQGLLQKTGWRTL